MSSGVVIVQLEIINYPIFLQTVVHKYTFLKINKRVEKRIIYKINENAFKHVELKGANNDQCPGFRIA